MYFHDYCLIRHLLKLSVSKLTVLINQAQRPAFKHGALRLIYLPILNITRNLLQTLRFFIHLIFWNIGVRYCLDDQRISGSEQS
jgi:hypothetical protein